MLFILEAVFDTLRVAEPYKLNFTLNNLNIYAIFNYANSSLVASSSVSFQDALRAWPATTIVARS